MSRIFWDTNLFIYLWEWHGDLHDRVAVLRRRMIGRGDELCTSTMTLSEVLVKPLREKETDLARRHETALTSAGVLLVPFDRGAARIYAELRRDPAIRALDAIQLACAARVRCNMFVTNDERLSHRVVPGVDFIVSLSRAFL